MGSLVFVYFLLCLIFFVIAVAVLRWAFRINKIVSELEQIRETLIVAQSKGEATKPKILVCTQCGAEYSPKDYRPEASGWLCPQCGKPLPKE